MLSAAVLLLHSPPVQRDVAHIVTEHEEAVGKMLVMLFPSSVPHFPTSQHATTTEALHPVTLAKVIEAGLGQISGSHRRTRGPRRQGLKPSLLTLHVRGHWVGGLIHHLSSPQTILQVFFLLVV